MEVVEATLEAVIARKFDRAGDDGIDANGCENGGKGAEIGVAAINQRGEADKKGGGGIVDDAGEERSGAAVAQGGKGEVVGLGLWVFHSGGWVGWVI